MRAVVQRGFGPPSEVLRLEQVPDPLPGPGEVLVRVEAAGVNAADWHLVTGMPYVMRAAGLGVRGPKEPVPGLDLAGRVEAVGTGVSRFQPGDRVFGSASRAFAQLVNAPEERLAPVPAGLSSIDAAAAPLAAVTALQGLRQGGLAPGRRVLVTGASGGVGTFAVQIAAARGARVTAVCSTRNVELMRGIGAHNVIDYTSTDITRWRGTYDQILHLAGPMSLPAARRLLAPDGTLVLSSGEGGPWWGPLPQIARAVVAGPIVRRRFRILTARMRRDDLVEVAEMLASGAVKPVIDRTYPLEAVAAAVRYLQDGHTQGKVVLTV
jgi:NADPH:quinone reductase-like Zn-dependent oxidoreductase